MGRINSVETMGLVDGPGIRFVVFMQGCGLRCLYCHNPETWNSKEGYEIGPSEIVDKIKRYKNYFGEEGGVTFSGGEPLLQPEFLIETLKLCKKEGIHTCLDTSGYGTDKDEEVLQNVDLVILDIKAVSKEDYEKITRKGIEKYQKFLSICQKLNKPLWLRQVIVPNINDSKESILELKEHIKNIKNVQKIELIPYHTYGKEKYNKMGINYPLQATEAMKLDKLEQLNKLLNN